MQVRDKGEALQNTISFNSAQHLLCKLLQKDGWHQHSEDNIHSLSTCLHTLGDHIQSVF